MKALDTDIKLLNGIWQNYIDLELYTIYIYITTTFSRVCNHDRLMII